MNSETWKLLTAAGGGAVLGFILATYGAGQYVAVQTALRDQALADNADLLTTNVARVMEAGDVKLAKVTRERDEAQAALLRGQPKDVQPRTGKGMTVTGITGDDHDATVEVSDDV